MTESEGNQRDAPLTGLSHVQLVVSDVGASAEWYSAALGLETYRQDLDVGYVALRHRASKMVFVLTAGPSGASAAPGAGTGDGAGLDHLAFSVPDRDALLSWADHLTDVGIDHPGVVLENGNPSLQLRDPDGTAIELVAPVHHAGPMSPSDAGPSPDVPGPGQGDRYTPH